MSKESLEPWEIDALLRFQSVGEAAKFYFEVAEKLRAQFAEAKAENERLKRAESDLSYLSTVIGTGFLPGDVFHSEEIALRAKRAAKAHAAVAERDKLLTEREEREPAGQVMRWNQGGSGEYVSVEGKVLANLPHGTKLYLHPPVPAVPEWLPIETAPKDGKTILLRHCDGRMLEALFDNVKDGWVGAMCGLTYQDGIWCFTHWMPLPAAPKEPT